MAISNNRLTAEQYEQNFSDIHPPFESREAALVEANRCLFCYDAPCTKRCPTSINIPKFIKQITTDNVKGSAYTILDANIMGGGCSKVCPVEKLCEGSCVFNLLDEPPIPIAKLQRYSTEKAIAHKWPLFQRKPATGRKVAVVGAGPAGLSCAHVLSREGVDVTIYEKESKGGGLMTYGIAAYKVTPEFCERGKFCYIAGRYRHQIRAGVRQNYLPGRTTSQLRRRLYRHWRWNCAPTGHSGRRPDWR